MRLRREMGWKSEAAEEGGGSFRNRNDGRLLPLGWEGASGL